MDNKWKKPVMWIAVSITIAIGMIATKSIFCLFGYIFHFRKNRTASN